jgi:hypothetical protein
MKVLPKILLVISAAVGLWFAIGLHQSNAVWWASPVLFLVPALLVYALGSLLAWKIAPPPLPEGFQPSFRARNIALDTQNDMLWLRPTEGRALVLPKRDVRTWEHNWTRVTTGLDTQRNIRNQITFRTGDLSRPVIKVAVGSHRVAEEWQSRLTTWING